MLLKPSSTSKSQTTILCGAAAIPGDKMLLLFETAAGFALFKVRKERKLQNVKDLQTIFSSVQTARKMVRLKSFLKFDNTSEALEAATLLNDGKPNRALRHFLRANCQNETLAVADSRLGNIISDRLNIKCLHNNAVMELMRGVRFQLNELIAGLPVRDMASMSLGLSHSLSRHKLKFSADKVDTMTVQAIGLLVDLDKELNRYAMRVCEWYGCHFPELTKIISDNRAKLEARLRGLEGKELACFAGSAMDEDTQEPPVADKKKKKKKESTENAELQNGGKKKKKRKRHAEEEDSGDMLSKKKEKKKKRDV